MTSKLDEDRISNGSTPSSLASSLDFNDLNLFRRFSVPTIPKNSTRKKRMSTRRKKTSSLIERNQIQTMSRIDVSSESQLSSSSRENSIDGTFSGRSSFEEEPLGLGIGLGLTLGQGKLIFEARTSHSVNSDFPQISFKKKMVFIYLFIYEFSLFSISFFFTYYFFC